MRSRTFRRFHSTRQEITPSPSHASFFRQGVLSQSRNSKTRGFFIQPSPKRGFRRCHPPVPPEKSSPRGRMSATRGDYNQTKLCGSVNRGCLADHDPAQPLYTDQGQTEEGNRRATIRNAWGLGWRKKSPTGEAIPLCARSRRNRDAAG